MTPNNNNNKKDPEHSLKNQFTAKILLILISSAVDTHCSLPKKLFYLQKEYIFIDKNRHNEEKLRIKNYD